MIAKSSLPTYFLVALAVVLITSQRCPGAVFVIPDGDVGTGKIGNRSVSGSQVTVDLTGVLNAQQIVLTLSGVGDGVATEAVSIPMAILLGDTNGDSVVDASDVAQTKGQSGQAVSTSNFRTDVNVSGTITASDVASVKAQVGTSASPNPVRTKASPGR